jgi:Domain of unknown function (DUF4169)
MGDIVNLQQYRKKLKREQAARKATQNRAQFGRGKSERRGTDNARQRNDKEFDGKRLRRDDDDNPTDRRR